VPNLPYNEVTMAQQITPLRQGIRWKRLARLGAFCLVLAPLIVLAITAGFAAIYANQLLHVGCQGDLASQAEFGYPAEAVTFPSSDGVELRGWFSAGQTDPGVAIIALPGHGGNTRFALPDALILADAGYSTLVFEPRYCADPDRVSSTGVHEARDVLGAVAYLQSRADVAHIGALGFSAGGTSLLLAAAQTPALEAVIAMGGYDSLRDDVLETDVNLGWYERLMRHMILWTIGLEGVSLREASPVDVIGQISPRPVLLIYGEAEAEPGVALYEAAQPPKDIWIVPGAVHGSYPVTAPDEYRRRILDFFDAAFR
jgi:dipeptidyl aminopeptidase/acylaminoacyl peptidase